jgi:hypothetical protein
MVTKTFVDGIRQAITCNACCIPVRSWCCVQFFAQSEFIFFLHFKRFWELFLAFYVNPVPGCSFSTTGGTIYIYTLLQNIKTWVKYVCVYTLLAGYVKKTFKSLKAELNRGITAIITSFANITVNIVWNIYMNFFLTGFVWLAILFMFTFKALYIQLQLSLQSDSWCRRIVKYI